MKKAILVLLICKTMMFYSIPLFAEGLEEEQTIADTALSTVLCTPDPSPEAVALFRYLLDMHGQKILSGQMWVSWGINEINYIETVTGKLPAIAGVDYITESSNSAETQRAISYWRNGGIPTIMWHWGAPGVGEGYDNSKATIDIDSCFIEGTPQYNAFWLELERKADWLEVLRDSGVPVLWRPYHELSGNWFWWSKEGPGKFKLLWNTMFNYFVNDRGLNNLIWVLCYTDSPSSSWFPGVDYMDIIGGDVYGVGSDPQLIMYRRALNVVDDSTRPICYHECGVPPDPDLCLSRGAMWSWWMIWHTGILEAVDQDYLTEVYNHDLIITLDEVPNIMAVYGWDDNCAATKITPSLQVNGGIWRETNTIPAAVGAQIVLRTEADGSGTWNWSGCGVSGTSNEQTLTVSGPCTVTATYLNECGATRTQTFNIRIGVTPSEISSSQIEDNSLVSIYPVPSDDYLNIVLHQQQNNPINKITVCSMTGVLLLENIALSDHITLNISGLQEGMYFIKIESGDKQIVHKFAKIKN